MILIGEDEDHVVDDLTAKFLMAGITAPKIKPVRYLQPGGGGTSYTAKKMAEKFELLAISAEERTAFVIDLSPEMRSEHIVWGLTMLAELSSSLHGGVPMPDCLYKLLLNRNFLFILHSKHDLKPKQLADALAIDAAKIDYWSSYNRAEWEHSSIPTERLKPLLIYTRKVVDDARLISIVATWLKS